jgi:hypothetical protein
VRVTMEKLPGVESAALKLNEGRAVLELRPENTLTLGQVRESVRRNGFTPREARVTATAEVLSGDTLRLRVAGTQDVYVVRTTAALEQQLRAVATQSVSVEGTVPVLDDPAAGMVLQVTNVGPVTRYGI